MIKGKIAQDQLEKQIFWVTFRSLLVIPIFLVNFLMFIGAVISFFVGGIIVVTIIWIIINIIVFTVIFTSARKTQNQLLVFNGIHKETKKELGEANILILLASSPSGQKLILARAESLAEDSFWLENIITHLHKKNK